MKKGLLAFAAVACASLGLAGSAFATDVTADLTLTGDITDGIVVKSGSDVTIDLNGYDISTTESEDTIYVENGATLTIKGNGEITNVAGYSNLFNNGTVTIEGGTLAHAGGYYGIANHGVMTIVDATVTGDVNTNSLIVNGYYNYSDSANEREGYVAGKGHEAPSLTIKGGEFTQNGVNTIVKNDENGTVVIEDGVFTSNTATTIQNAHVMTIKGGTFNQNKDDRPVIKNTYYYDDLAKAELIIEGGVFNSTLGTIENLANNGQTGAIAISGGTFSDDIAEYLEEGLEQDDNGTVVDPTVENPKTGDSVVFALTALIASVFGLAGAAVVAKR